MPSVEVLTCVTFPCSQFIHSISSSLTGQRATGAGRQQQTPQPQSQHSQSPSGQSPPCSPSGLCAEGAPGAAAKSPRSFVPRGSEAAQLTTHRLGTLLLWDFRIYSRGQKVFCRKESQPVPAIPDQDFTTAPPQCLSFSWLLSTSLLVSKGGSRSAEPASRS